MIRKPWRMFLVDLFLDAHTEAQEEIILDLDATDDPQARRVHGRG